MLYPKPCYNEPCYKEVNRYLQHKIRNYQTIMVIKSAKSWVYISHGCLSISSTTGTRNLAKCGIRMLNVECYSKTLFKPNYAEWTLLPQLVGQVHYIYRGVCLIRMLDAECYSTYFILTRLCRMNSATSTPDRLVINVPI